MHNGKVLICTSPTLLQVGFLVWTLEFERALIKERQREGIALAKLKGAYKGRKKALSPEQINELKTCILGGEKKAQLARKYGISRETLYQYLRN